jgi:methionine-S-sulfoxide reductase
MDQQAEATMRMMGMMLAAFLLAAATPAGALETATFAGGCFWGMEEFFRKVPGVVETRVGYTGGKTASPDYAKVGTGATGHAEAVEIRFDPARVSYDKLLELFFKMHDPTTRDRQGNDVGSQYRSAVFTHGEAQRKAAEAMRQRIERSKAWRAPLTTQIAPAGKFHPAEEDHQKYLVKHPDGYDNHYVRKLEF